MAELKTKPTGASVESFLNSIADEQRRADCLAVARLMKSVTRAEPKMWGTSIVGFGDVHYKYASGHEADWFLTGFSPRKRDLTLYVLGCLERPDDLLAGLGKHKAGKGCLYIKRLDDIDAKVLKQLIATSVKQVKQMYPA